MTIKSSKIFKITLFDNINLNKLILFVLIFMVLFLSTLNTILPVEMIVKLTFFNYILLFGTGYFFIMDHNDLNLTHKRHLIITMSLFSILLINGMNIQSAYKTVFVNIIKREHPHLSTNFSECSKKENIILDDYKLIHENSKYYIVNNGIKYDIDEVAKYEYEEKL